jgi:hypothetical protein
MMPQLCIIFQTYSQTSFSGQHRNGKRGKGMARSKDGSGLVVFRCKGKTYCPDVMKKPVPKKWETCKLRHKRKMRHQPHGGPAELAKKNESPDRLRRFMRKRLYRFKKKPVPTNPIKTDTRYHARKRFEGRPARTKSSPTTKAKEKMRLVVAKLKAKPRRADLDVSLRGSKDQPLFLMADIDVSSQSTPL